MRVTHDNICRVWLYIEVAAHLEGMSDYDYRRWLLKRLICNTTPRPQIRTISANVAPRHEWWQYRRDDWRYVHESTLTPPAYAELLRLRRREFTAEEAREDDLTGKESFYVAIPGGQRDVELSLRMSLVELAVTAHLPGLIGCAPAARHLDVRPGLPLRTLHADTARRVQVFSGLDATALRDYRYMQLEHIKTGVAERADLSKAAADRAVTALFAELRAALTQGESITIQGFGTFKIERRAERTCINPQTKQQMTVPAKNAPVFRAAPALKEAVNA